VIWKAILIRDSHGNCNTLQHTATHCNTLQHTATHCNTLQHTASRCKSLQLETAIWNSHNNCNTLQHTATHCNTLQHTATHCNTLQHAEAHCFTLQCSTLLHSATLCKRNSYLNQSQKLQHTATGRILTCTVASDALWSEDCFYYCSERKNVVVLFGTLKVQFFILTEGSECMWRYIWCAI